jgi:hypothetical protein
MSSEIDHPRQRTVAELLAAHGDVNATGRRRRRRDPDGADEGAQVGDSPSAEWPRSAVRDPGRSARQDRAPVDDRREPRRRRSADADPGGWESALGSTHRDPGPRGPARDPLPRSGDPRSPEPDPWERDGREPRPGRASREDRSRERPSAEPPWASAQPWESASSWESAQSPDAAEPWEPTPSPDADRSSWEAVEPLGSREHPRGRGARSREVQPGPSRESARSRSRDVAPPWEGREPIAPPEPARPFAREVAPSWESAQPRAVMRAREEAPPWDDAEPEQASPRDAGWSRGATRSRDPQSWGDEDEPGPGRPGTRWESPVWERGSTARELGSRGLTQVEPPPGAARGRAGAAAPLGPAADEVVQERPTELMPRLREAGPRDSALTSRIQQPRRRPDPDADAPLDDDGGPATVIGAPPVGAEGWHQGGTGRRNAVDDGGPPTQAAPLDLDDDEPPAGLARGDSGDMFDADELPSGSAGARSRSSADEDPEEEAAQSWGAVIAQCIAGGIGGAALWVAFRFLWRDLPVVAVAAAVLVTVGLVVLIRAIQPRKDLRTTLFAVAVGVLVTISPVILVLLGK